MSGEVTLTIDGREITVREGEKLLWAALDNGIYIPHLCADRKEEKPDAACRLCFVEIEGRPQPVTACSEPVAAGMVVNTRSERVDRLAGTAFELLLSSHRLDCGKCAANRSCALQKIARERKFKLKVTRLRTLDRNLPVDDSSPVVTYDPNKCVLCGHCVRACRRQGGGVLGFAGRGFERRVTTFGGASLAAAGCSGCGACAAACPVGALTAKNVRLPNAGAKR
ncbi:2Fe-2S iron-sulfur cluster-binding protein [Desulfotomaculum copahuensis]|uniref:Ferredoxin n=1 Tax=Desulfotomaculum copahuensis TaxID=1838280 RepID=A0A1B7LKH8_9FIRM|nr:2Fe-2S iron-sulfur cluster-binding protein [Desulfotomaculum copahuensis]OAT87076.1 ferredoxin [Desulfotomaculum copahuensis]